MLQYIYYKLLIVLVSVLNLWLSKTFITKIHESNVSKVLLFDIFLTFYWRKILQKSFPSQLFKLFLVNPIKTFYECYKTALCLWGGVCCCCIIFLPLVFVLFANGSRYIFICFFLIRSSSQLFVLHNKKFHGLKSNHCTGLQLQKAESICSFSIHLQLQFTTVRKITGVLLNGNILSAWSLTAKET